MPSPTALTIINVGFRSTNYWVISAGPSRLNLKLGRVVQNRNLLSEQI